MVPNVGIVGFGKMGILHAGIVNALPNCKITAVCERQPVMTRIAKKLLPHVNFYDDISEMTGDTTIDAFFITSPIGSHSSIIRAIRESGVKVGLFSEKPLATNGAEAREAAEAAAKLERPNMVGYHNRFSPIYQHAKKLLDGMAIGDLQMLRAYSYTADIFRRGTGWRFEKGSGGALLDLGPHILDLLLWFFGEPEHVSAIERSFYSTQVEDYVHAIVSFRSGLVGGLDISWSQRGYRLPEIRIEVQGTNGFMSISDDYLRIRADNPVKNVVEAGSQVIQKPSLNSSVDFLLAEPEYTLEDKYFLDALVEGRQVEPSFHTAVKTNDFVDMIHKAAAAG
jgi:predicted dehydrogenase